MPQTENTMSPIAGFPTCPFCEEDLDSVGMFSWQSQNGAILCVYCPNPECRKALSFELLPLAPAAMLEQKSKSIIDA